MGGLVAAVLLAGALLVGYQLAVNAFGDDDTPPTTSPSGSSTTTAPALVDLDIAGASSYDLESTGGNGEENEELAGNAFDGDPATAWTTLNYNDPMNAQGKDGVGLVLDLGADRSVSEVELSLLTAGGRLELRAAPPGSTAVPGAITEWAVVSEQEGPTQELTVQLDEPVTTRYVLVWFTELPAFEDTLKDGIAEAVVRGT